MRNTLFMLVCTLSALAAQPWQAQAAGNPTHQRGPNWNQRDTAVYVVSTLNLVRVHHRSLTSVLSSQDVTQYDVYADLDVGDQYYIQLKRDDGNVVGVLAYRMGWLKPKSISAFTDKLGVRKAPRSMVTAYKSNHKELIGSFTSTLPT